MSQLNILNKINEITNFTTNEKIIASYILEFPEQVTEMPIRKLAEVTYTSPLVLFGLIRNLGFQAIKNLPCN